MKNVLILADGLSAEHFIKRLNQKRIGQSRYVVITPNIEFNFPEKFTVEIETHIFDPTSYSKLRSVLYANQFHVVFIVLNSPEETKESLKNIREVDEKIRVYLLDHWDKFDESDESYTKIFNIHHLIANRLYDHLPNVPLVAQNVGLYEGEIMEIAIPFGSSFAYRHIGSISQVKWRIVAIYRNSKLILPTSATMIKPQDSILIIGKQNILSSIYSRIINKDGLFPEPFGRNLYLVLDMDYDTEQLLNYINETLHMRDRLEDKKLIIRVVNPCNFDLLNKIKSFGNDSIEIVIYYGNKDIFEIITADMQSYNIGLVFVSQDTFLNKDLSSELYSLKKLVYIYGDTPLYSIIDSVILVGDNKEMESISSTSFYISETLGFNFRLCNFDPEGNFESKKMILKHYETLSHATHYPINIEEKKVNPIRALSRMENILQILPMAYDTGKESFLDIFSTKSKDHIFKNTKHPILLIPAVLDK